MMSSVLSPKFGQLTPVSIPETFTPEQKATLEQFISAWNTPSIAQFVQEAEQRRFDVTPMYVLNNDRFQFSAKLSEHEGELKCPYKTDATELKWVVPHRFVPSLQNGGSWNAADCVHHLLVCLTKNLCDIKTFDNREFNLNDLIA